MKGDESTVEATKEETPKFSLERIQRYELPMGVLGLAVDSQGNQFYAGCMDGVYRLDGSAAKDDSNADDSDTDDSRAVDVSSDYEKLYAHDSYAANVELIPETNSIVSAGYDGAIQWYDLNSKSVKRHVQAHGFWSWDMARATKAPVIASVSGQYLAGSYDYRPRASEDPCIRVYDAISGSLIRSIDFGPPVQAVAVTDDGKYVAAGNLMGDAIIVEVATGDVVGRWSTSDFTAFGIIKSHCQIGGIYAATFAHNHDLLVGGMGPMRDPMAGNGKQRWQRIRWRNGQTTAPSADAEQVTAEKVAASKDEQAGEGLMETLAMHPGGQYFVMAGRLRGGSWNVGLFELESGDLVHSFKNGIRVTKARFSEDGQYLYLAGAKKQSAKADKAFGVIDVHKVSIA